MMEFGERFKVRIFGSSHGPEVGVEVGGVPPGTPMDPAQIQSQLDRRRPVGRRLATKRQEEDQLIVDTGIVSGRASGDRIRAHVANQDVRREPYDRLRDTPRPGHADYPARVRFGAEADLSGGGIFSGRMTVGLVIAGSIAEQLLAPLGVEVVGFTRSIASVVATLPEDRPAADLRTEAAANEVGCPEAEKARVMEVAIAEARKAVYSVCGYL